MSLVGAKEARAHALQYTGIKAQIGYPSRWVLQEASAYAPVISACCRSRGFAALYRFCVLGVRQRHQTACTATQSAQPVSQRPHQGATEGQRACAQPRMEPALVTFMSPLTEEVPLRAWQGL